MPTIATPLRAASAALCLLLLAPSPTHAQGSTLDSTEKARAREMLGTAKSAIRSTYYDKAFHGIDLDAHFKAADAKIDTATSLGHAYAIIAQALIDFGDSHTYFLPPERPASYDYGWQYGMVGDGCFVLAVKPGSNAEAKGIKPGDRITQIGAFTPSRAELWKVRYLYHVLSPKSVLKVAVQSPGGQPRAIDINAKVTQERAVVEVSLDALIESGPGAMGDPIVRVNRNAMVGDIAISKLSTFAVADSSADKMMDDMLKGASSLVLDLRGNGGGLIKTLELVAGRFFDHDVKMADRVGRKNMKPMVAKKRKTPFTGKLVVLVDADSASASEILARVVQLEKRGVVIGDRSSGSVMQAEQGMGVLEGTDGVIPYAFSITNADLIMADGKSLEHAGVVPDEIVLRTPADLAAGRDPALARAVALLGGTLDPVAAGKMFPVEWK